MDSTQMIAAITTALQTPDANGNLTNVITLMQFILIRDLQNASPDQLQTICNLLNISTGN